MLPWLGAYLLVIVAWAVIIARRSTPTLWKGSSLLIVNAIFVAATILYAFAQSGLHSAAAVKLPRSTIFFDVVLILIGLWLSRSWLLVGITHEEATEILERCFTQTRSSATRRGPHHVVKCGDIDMIAGIQKNRVALGTFHLPLPGHVVRFRGAEKSKKAGLIRSLFTKQFGSSFPTPRIKA